MSCQLTEEELWSGLDRNAPEMLEHVECCPTCRERAGRLRAGIAAVATASEPEVGPIPERIGPYRVQRRLGVGGMGIVYEGEQENPRRLVAVKVVRGEHYVDDYRVRLFQREVETLARLKHPAIAAIYEAGRTGDGQHYFAMELVRGVPLNDFVIERNLPLRKRLELFCAICDAIHYAHQRGVIHRDIKPSNILVDVEGNPKILDFGLARISDSEMGATTTGSLVGRVMGTLPYMSPEEARGNPDEIDVRGDVYSLGVILYETLTGNLPHTVSRRAIPEAIRVICEEPPCRPSLIDRSLRGDLETIILKSLEKERGRRYQSPAALAEDIRRYLRNEPIFARRTSTFYLARKFVQRHSVVFVLIALMITAGGFVQYFSERVQRDTANATILNSQQGDIARAAVFEDMARDYRGIGTPAALDKSARLFRDAMHTYERLTEEGIEPVAGAARQRLAGVKVGLARTLIARGASSRDYDDAFVLMANGLGLYETFGFALPESEGQAVVASLQILRQYREDAAERGERNLESTRQEGDESGGDSTDEAEPSSPEESEEESPAEARENRAATAQRGFTLGEVDAVIRLAARLAGQPAPEAGPLGPMQ